MLLQKNTTVLRTCSYNSSRNKTVIRIFWFARCDIRSYYALPPMGKDTEWFSDMLGVLIELACPNTGLPPKGKAFITDLRRGLSAKMKME